MTFESLTLDILLSLLKFLIKLLSSQLPLWVVLSLIDAISFKFTFNSVGICILPALRK